VTPEAINDVRERVRSDRSSLVRELTEVGKLTTMQADSVIDAFMKMSDSDVQRNAALLTKPSKSGKTNRLVLDGEANGVRAGLAVDGTQLAIGAAAVAACVLSGGLGIGILVAGTAWNFYQNS
jgi:hypothetical protein